MIWTTTSPKKKCVTGASWIFICVFQSLTFIWTWEYEPLYYIHGWLNYFLLKVKRTRIRQLCDNCHLAESFLSLFIYLFFQSSCISAILFELHQAKAFVNHEFGSILIIYSASYDTNKWITTSSIISYEWDLLRLFERSS